MKSKNLLISVAITLAFACMILFLVYPSNSPLGDLFDAFIVLIAVRYIAIGYGVLMLLLRVVKVLKDNQLLIYILAGTLNIFLAIVGFALYFTGMADLDWLHQSTVNLLVGFLILADTFFIESRLKAKM